MSRLRVLALATALAVPGAASADVAIKIPRNLLGGRVAPGNPLPPPADPDAPNDPANPIDPDFTDGVDGIDLLAPNFWALAWPNDAGPVADPGGFAADCDEDANPGSCGLWGNEAAQLVPLDEVIPTIDPGQSAPTTTDVAARLRPAIGTWMADQTPTLRWTPEPGATHYNVQIYLGPRRVASAWTTDRHLTVPPRVLDQGRYYMWAVWPGFGAPKLGEFDGADRSLGVRHRAPPADRVHPHLIRRGGSGAPAHPRRHSRAARPTRDGRAGAGAHPHRRTRPHPASRHTGPG